MHFVLLFALECSAFCASIRPVLGACCYIWRMETLAEIKTLIHAFWPQKSLTRWKTLIQLEYFYFNLIYLHYSPDLDSKNIYYKHRPIFYRNGIITNSYNESTLNILDYDYFQDDSKTPRSFFFLTHKCMQMMAIIEGKKKFVCNLVINFICDWKRAYFFSFFFSGSFCVVRWAYWRFRSVNDRVVCSVLRWCQDARNKSEWRV